MRTYAYLLGIALLLSSSLANAAAVHRLWNGTNHFYTTSLAEAQYLASIGWNLDAVNYFYTDDTPNPNTNNRELLRCYSSSRNAHAFILRFVNGSGCEGIGYSTEGSLGYVRLRGECVFTGFSFYCYQEDYPIAGKGRPLWTVSRPIRQMPDGSNVPGFLLTISQSEAQAVCGKGWTYSLANDASSSTCLSGYVAN